MENSEQEYMLHPRMTADLKEAELQEVIRAVEHTAVKWERKVEKAITKGHSQGRITELAGRGMEKLDNMWPYEGENFLVTGKLIKPAFHYSIEEGVLHNELVGVRWEHAQQEALETQRTLGFGYRMIEGKFRYVYVFSGEIEHFSAPYMGGNFTPQVYAVPEAISLTLMTSPEEEEGIVHTNLVHETLAYYDQLLSELVTDESFTELSHEQQQSNINSLVDTVNDIISSPGSVIDIQCTTADAYARVEASTPYGFERVDSAEQMPKGIAIPIHGELLGVTMLEKDVLELAPLKETHEFVDRTAGLCLIIEPHNSGGTVLVPYLSAQIDADGINICPEG